MSTLSRIVAPFLLSAIPAILVTFTAPASADTVHTRVDASSMCQERFAEVVRWTPSKGPAARFIVDSDASLVVLGRTDKGFWAAVRESGDACDAPGCTQLDLLFTPFDGSPSKRYPVQKWGEGDRHTPAEMRQVMLRRLWKLAGATWPIGSLRHDYALVTPQSKDGSPPKHPGWLAEAVMAGRWRVRWDHNVRSHMCWCDASWRAVAR